MFRTLNKIHGIVFCVLLLVAIAVSTTYAKPLVSGVSPQCPTPPDYISVKYQYYFDASNKEPDYIESIPIETYTLGVVMGELGPNLPGSGQAWDNDVLRAQGIAARTWGSYWCHKNSYYVLDGQPDQEYQPNHPQISSALKNTYQNVLERTKGLYLSYENVNFWDGNYEGVLLDAQYRSHVGNPSTSWYNNGSGYQYFRSVNNPYHTGISLGPGWAQHASQSWANLSPIGASWYQTLMHYYTGAQINNKQPAMFADYWNNINCSGSPTLSYQMTNSINYDWGTGSPAPGINADHFCVKWYLNNYDFGNQDEYTFYIMADDGFRLYIDGNLVLDKWVSQSPTLYSVTAMDMSGVHNVRLEYFENGGGAVARMSWQPGTGMIGRYYDQTISKTGALPSNPVLYRVDSDIRFNWANSSPLDTREGPERIYEDTYGIQWESHVYLTSCGTYWVRTWSDDGIFVRAHTGTGWHNIIDNWTNHAPTLDGSIFYACAGTYPVEARYYENSGGSVVDIDWTYIPPLQ